MNNITLNFITKTRPRKNQDVFSHSHLCNEIVMYFSGDGETVIGKNKYQIKTGSIAFIHKGTKHSEHHCADSKIIFFGYDEPHCRFSIDEGVYNLSEFESLAQIANFMYEETKMQKYSYKLILSAALTTFLVLFERKTKNDVRQNKSLEYCANYMYENCANTIDIKLLAKEYGYNYDTFRHIFKSEYGMAPLEYIIARRLSNAYSLLSETNMSCTDISMQCGFSDSSQFSKMFKKKFGLSPKQFQMTRRNW